MSDSDSQENFCYFGTPLDPIDEDEVPRKKPISVEEQIATDAHGRRRFHGAFTGGFSAGFYNTVGSLEGWTPTDFKSSRSDKAKNLVQKPQDFMDDEDIGEFGIAPQGIKATKEYSTTKKRKRVFAEGPIPGEPVLETLITGGNETVGYLLLKNIGIQDKVVKRDEELNPGTKVYGCEIPKTCNEIPADIENKQYKINSMYEQYLSSPKTNTFGIGYKGLDRSHVNLFKPASLVVRERDNKKISITGQAFGVGAFEEDDEDIYFKEDMNAYDFELTKEKTASKDNSSSKELLFGMFKNSRKPLIFKKEFPPPTIPQSFTGKHKVKKSRFEPIEEQPCDRSKINPSIRARYLGEAEENNYTPSKTSATNRQDSDSTTSSSRAGCNNTEPFPTQNCDPPDPLSSLLFSDRFVSASQVEDVSNILLPVEKTITTHGTEQMRDAVKLKMFGPLTRVTADWHPCALLCKRFNVPEPFKDHPELKNRKRTRNLIFEQPVFNEDAPVLKPGLSAENVKSEIADVNKTDSSSVPEAITIRQESNSNIKVTDTEISKIEIEEVNVPENTKEKQNKADDENVQTVIDLTEKINIEEKMDLFKAVFLSSDESEEEKEENADDRNDNNNKDSLKSAVLLAPLIPVIKTTKHGILSNLNFHKFKVPEKKSEQDVKKESVSAKTVESSDIETTSSYGPRLPEGLNKSSEVADVQLSSDDSDEWVEKDDSDKKRHKKSKKKRVKHKRHKKDKKQNR